jgi:hypothetical protein
MKFAGLQGFWAIPAIHGAIQALMPGQKDGKSRPFPERSLGQCREGVPDSISELILGEFYIANVPSYRSFSSALAL